MLIENAEEHIDNPDFRSDMFATLRGTVARMKDLTQKLKNIPEKPSFDKKPVNLKALVCSAIEDVKENMPTIDLRYSGVDVIAQADSNEIRKVLLNLFLNSHDAVEGSGEIRVRTDRNGAKAFITVSDNGCGMSEDYVANHLFRPFRTTKEKGLGIGLYQCRQIVEAQGGNIEVESRQGEGTAFSIRLPLHGQ